jgi:CRISPR-associated protein Cas8a1/Csx13
MAESETMLDGSEMPFVQAIHRAIYRGLGKIYSETMGREATAERRSATNAVRIRWKKFFLEVRLALLGAKTASQVQLAVNKLFANAGGVRELKDHTAATRVLELLFRGDWRRVQSLALFALASYKRPPKAEEIPGGEDIEAIETA